MGPALPRGAKSRPYDQQNSISVYTTPRFIDTTLGRAHLRSVEAARAAEEAADAAQKKADEARAWAELAQELEDEGVQTVAELPEDRQRHWKLKLDRPLVTYL